MRTSTSNLAGATRALAQVLLAAMVLFPAPTWAQEPQGADDPEQPAAMSPVVQAAFALLAELLPGSSGITGVVVDARLEPLPGAYVELRRLHDGALRRGALGVERVLHTRSDAEGAYHMSSIPPGAYALTVLASNDPELGDADFDECAGTARVDACGDEVAISRFITVVEEPDTLVALAHHDLAVPLGADPTDAFRGRLTGSFDPARYVYEVRFTIAIRIGGGRENVTQPTTPEGRDNVSFGALPNADGSFDFGGMPLKEFDSVDVWIRERTGAAEGGAVPAQEPLRIHRQPLFRRDPTLGPIVEIELPELRTVRVHLAGRPDDHRRRPFAGLTLNTTTLDERGGSSSQRIDPGVDVAELLLPLGAYAISATQEEHRAHAPRVELESDNEPLELRLDLTPTEPIEFEVVDSRGEPIDGAYLQIETGADEFVPFDGGMSRLGWTTVEHGRARLEYVEPGTYPALLILADGTNYEFELSVGPEMEPLVLAR